MAQKQTANNHNTNYREDDNDFGQMPYVHPNIYPISVDFQTALDFPVELG